MFLVKFRGLGGWKDVVGRSLKVPEGSWGVLERLGPPEVLKDFLIFIFSRFLVFFGVQDPFQYFRGALRIFLLNFWSKSMEMVPSYAQKTVFGVNYGVN